VRVRIVTSALAVALAAGCSGGHGAAGPKWTADTNVFAAHVRISLLHPAKGSSAGPPQTMLVDRDGRFRIVATSKRFRYRTVSISDDRTATRQWGSSAHPIVTSYRGSQRFLAEQAGGLSLRIVQAYVTGTAPPFGVHLHVVTSGPPSRIVATTSTERLRITIGRAGHVAASAFRPARRRAREVVRELRPGVRPGSAVPAYWLGPAWRGHPARSSSAESGDGGWYTCGYPHVAVSVTAPLRGYGGGAPVTLADGTPATLQVAALRPDGTVSLSSSSGEGSAEGEIFLFSSTGNPGRTIAFVFLPHAMITLSGTGVTPRSARAMARSLRPL